MWGNSDTNDRGKSLLSYTVIITFLIKIIFVTKSTSEALDLRLGINVPIRYIHNVLSKLSGMCQVNHPCQNMSHCH